MSRTEDDTENLEHEHGDVDTPIIPTNASTEETSSDDASGSRLLSSKRKKLTFAAVALIYFSASTAFSVLSPFFPNEAHKKGCSKALVGLIFGVYPLIGFILSPVVGILLPHLGPRFALFCGLFIEGGTQVLFGFVDLMPDGSIFIAFCFLLRMIQAVGAAASDTSCFAIIAGEFPDSISAVLGTTETFFGIGLTIGPPLGGVLYEAGGFKLPFLVLGAVLLISLPFIYFMLPPYRPRPSAEQEERREGSILKLVLIPGVFVVSLTIFVSGSCLGFLDPTLSPFLKNTYNYSASKIGLVFLLTCGTYALSAPFLGWLADRANKRVMIILGLWTTALTYVLVGPWPVLVEHLHFPDHAQWLMLTGFSLLGFGVTLAIVPVMGDILETVREEGYADDLTTHGMVSGIFNSAFSMGAFIGPTLASSLVEKFSFPTAASIFGGVVAAQAVIMTIFTIVDACVKKTTQIIRKRRSTATDHDAPLLDEDAFA